MAATKRKSQLIPKEAFHFSQLASFSLVEVVLAMALVAMIALAGISSISYTLQSTALVNFREQATLLAAGGLEATTNIAAGTFSSVTPGTYGLTVSGNSWNLSGSSDILGIYTRQIQVSQVDSVTLDLISTVSWTQAPSGSVAIRKRITDWKRTLASVPWGSIVLRYQFNLAGTANGISLALNGTTLYTIQETGTNAFTVLDTSTLTSITQQGTATLVVNPTKISNNGTTVYVSDTGNANELQVVSAGTPTLPVVLGNANLTGNTDAVVVKNTGTTVYVGRQQNGSTSELAIINAAVPAAPVVQSELNLTSGGVVDMVKTGNYLVLATSDTAAELKVVNVTNPAAPTLGATYNLPGNCASGRIDYNGTYLAIGCDTNTVHLLQFTAPGTFGSIFNYTTSAAITDILIDAPLAGLIAVSTSTPVQQLLILDYSTPASISLRSSLAPAGVIREMIYDSARQLIITIGENDSSEVEIYGSGT